ncbi:hypothetical protein [Bartonella vinsonii]|uniref:hypothetical protein n=1 Tax=Bartonella vinsonii TaxID=33047 RepID=UPI00034CEE49|nr:hypothetical protein [Bartonella vinsonii]
MLENLFGRSETAPKASFYNGDGGRDLNMQTQKLLFIAIIKSSSLLNYTPQETFQAALN